MMGGWLEQMVLVAVTIYRIQQGQFYSNYHLWTCSISIYQDWATNGLFAAHPRLTELVPGYWSQESVFQHLLQVVFLCANMWETSVLDVGCAGPSNYSQNQACLLTWYCHSHDNLFHLQSMCSGNLTITGPQVHIFSQLLTVSHKLVAYFEIISFKYRARKVIRGLI